MNAELRKSHMRGLMKNVDRACDAFMAAFVAAYPAGTTVRWMHHGHEQVGTIIGVEDTWGHRGTAPSLLVTNRHTRKEVRITLYDVEQAEGYDRFAENGGAK